MTTTRNRSRRLAIRLAQTIVPLTLLLLASPSLAAGGDTAIERALTERLAKKDLDQIEVTLAGGTATIHGTVETLRDKAAAEKIVRKVVGDVEIKNRARVRATATTSEDLVAEVERALDSPHFNRVFDWVEAEVRGNEVVLLGWVTQGWKIQAAERRMSRIPGVTRVEAKIELLPVSINDDRIRFAAARNLYSSHGFIQYASMSNPPIHIVVRNGEVILLGQVHNRAEKALARSLVSSATLPFRIVNRLDDGSEGG